jgi:hypothetical protein
MYSEKPKSASLSLSLSSTKKVGQESAPKPNRIQISLIIIKTLERKGGTAAS